VVPPDALAERLHARLLAEGAGGDDRRLRGDLERLARSEAPLLHGDDVRRVVDEVAARVRGLGPLDALLADAAVSEVMVNGTGDVWVERGGRLARTDVVLDAATTGHLIERVVGPLGLRVDRASPLVDARLPDGSRVNAVVPPLAVDGPCLTIRRFVARRVELDDVCPPGVGPLLAWAVRGRLNVLVAGGTGAGKTTLLNALAAAIPAGERIVTVEDAAELKMPGPHIVRLEARPPNVEGRGAVALGELVRNALRMRPDRIVVGEARGGEVLDMLHAANTGHRGLLTTVHAGGADEVPRRLEAMAMSVPGTVPAVVRQLIGAIQAVVHLERTRSGRRVQVVAELCPDPDGLARAIPIRATSPQGGLAATGHTPLWADRLPAALSSLWDPAGSAAGVTALPIRRVTP
jgi:pilus assembly protein CpaF